MEEAMISQSRITDYTIVDGEPYEVAHTVPKFIDVGWQPYGRPLMTHYRTDGSGPEHMVQVLVKYEEPRPLHVYITNEVLNGKISFPVEVNPK